MAGLRSLPAEAERARLAELDDLELLSSALEQSFDDLTELAAYVCKTPMALVSFVGKEKQFFKAARSPHLSEAPREQSFCAHTIATAETLVIADTEQDERFAQNPFVTADPQIRFYAGAPIFGQNNHVLGTLCVIDQRPRVLEPRQIQALEALARQTTELLAQRRTNLQHQRTLVALRKSALQLGLAVEAGQLGIFTWYVERDEVLWEDQRIFQIFGRGLTERPITAAEFTARTVFPDDRQSFIHAYRQVQEQDDRLSWTGRFFHADGSVRWVEFLGVAKRNEAQELVLVGTAADRTEAQEAKERLVLERERTDVALQATQATTYEWSLDDDVVVWGGQPPFGRAASEVPTAHSLLSLVHAEDRSAFQELIASAALHERDFTYAYRAFWPDGSLHWIEGSGRVLRSQAGRSKRIVGINIDATARKQLETLLSIDRVRLDIALHATKANTYDWLPKTGEIRWAGPSPFGRDPQTVATAEAVFAIVHPDDKPGLQKVLEAAVAQGHTYATDFRALLPDGSVQWVRSMGSVQSAVAGEPVRVLGVNLDITDRKLAEQALIHTEKLAAVGRLASVISHEINNPLEAVTNLLFIVRMSENLSQDDRDHLALADRELARVGNITAQTLRFHRNESHPEKIELSALMRDLVELFHGRFTASHIAVELGLDTHATVVGYEGDIRQVLNNLMSNAFDAMRKGGRLYLRTRCAANWKDGRPGALITVADIGPGISQEQQSHIFEAFYSTKSINGNGLGLWIAQRIVHKHQGRLFYRSAAGITHGTVFWVWLPSQAASSAGEAWAQVASNE